MPVLLTPESKVGLLEQSMKIRSRRPVAPVCFPKVLFASRSFVNLARSHSVYRFSMSPDRQSTKFCFKDNTTKETKSFALSLNHAYEFIKFLDPPFFEVSPEDEDVSDYFCLMSYAKGKIGFDSAYIGDAFIGVIKCHWFQMNELACDGELLEGRDVLALPPKKFDLVRVEDVLSIDNLKQALELKATRLVLYINPPGDFSKRIRVPVEEWSVNNTVEQCEVHFYDNKSPILGIICTLAKVCPSLTRLTVFCEFDKQDGQPTIESAVGYLETTNVLVDRMIGELKKVPANCEIKIQLGLHSWSRSGNKYPRDCLTTFRRHIHLGLVEERSEHLLNGQTCTTFIIKHSDQRVSVYYKIATEYKYLEDDAIDMNGEDDSSDDSNTDLLSDEENDLDDDGMA